MDSTLTRGELTIMIAGGVMFVASFLPFYGGVSAWNPYLFPLATLLPIYGLVMAVHIAVTRIGKVRLPRSILGFTWEQVHLVLGLLCALMAIGWFVTDVGKRSVGIWVQVIGGIALAVGAVNLQRERNTGAF